MKPQLGDFISMKCSAADFFDRSVYFKKMVQQAHVFNIGKAKCTRCSETLDIEDTSDMYEHLFLKHKNDERSQNTVLLASTQAVYKASHSTVR